MFADLVVDFLVAQVGLDPDPRRGQLRRHVLRIAVCVGNDRRHHRLDRREPDRQLAGEVFDQDADEPFIRTEDRAVQHDGAVLLAILGDIGRVEPFGQDPV